MTSTQAADAALERLRNVLEGHVAKGSMTGAVALLGQGAHPDCLCIGTRTAASGEPMTRDTLFRLASMTKPIIAAAAMILVEEGTLRLDEPVERLLPELANRRVLRRPGSPLDDTVPAQRALTLEDLLIFCCGLGMLPGASETHPILAAINTLGLVGFGAADDAPPLTPDEWMRRLGQLPLMVQPGERWLYNTGSNVLGVLIARAAGRPLPEVLQKRLFEPLGMRDTAFFVPDSKQCRLATAYVPAAQGLAPYEWRKGTDWHRPPLFPAGDGGLVSTVDDYLAFSRLLAPSTRGKDSRPLSAAGCVAMTTDQLSAAQREGDPILGPHRGWGYGLGVYRSTSAEGVPAGAWGWDGGYGTTWRYDPATDRTLIVMTQTVMVAAPDMLSILRDSWRAAFAAQ